MQLIRNLRRYIILGSVLSSLACSTLSACGSSSRSGSDTLSEEEDRRTSVPEFSADSAYDYVKHQVDLGPRVPNTEAHRKASDWLSSELRKRGAEVIEQKVTLTAFDGTPLKAVNIMGRFQPEKETRLLLFAHYDCRPWADEDPDPSNHHKPVEGANDGASGVGVLLEVARLLQLNPLPDSAPGIDILFVDAEDWGSDNVEDSWALGAKYFVNNPPVDEYTPDYAILLDMVGSPDASFYKEYFSELAAPELTTAIWSAAASAGYGRFFIPSVGGAVTDDHRPLIDKGVRAIDIIDYRHNPEGFDPVWHTTADTMDNISPETLKAVGQTLTQFLYSF